jgi:hypothetical protein
LRVDTLAPGPGCKGQQLTKLLRSSVAEFNARFTKDNKGQAVKLEQLILFQVKLSIFFKRPLLARYFGNHDENPSVVFRLERFQFMLHNNGLHREEFDVFTVTPSVFASNLMPQGKGLASMSLQSENFEEWYEEIRSCIQEAVNRLEVTSTDGKRRKKGSALKVLLRETSRGDFNQRTLANRLTPTSENHDLSLAQAWHILNITSDMNSLMSLCRHKSMLLTISVRKLPVAEETLFPIFTKMRKELAETQDVFKKALEQRISSTASVSLHTKNELKREVHEDLCATMSMATQLEAMASTHAEDATLPDADSRFADMHAKLTRWAEALEESDTALAELRAMSGIRQADLDRFATEAADDSTVSFKLFLKILEADESNELLAAFCHSLGYRVYPLEPLEVNLKGKSVLEQFAELEDRQADTLQRLNQALKDQKITMEEVEEIKKELREEYATELAILNTFIEPDPEARL